MKSWILAYLEDVKEECLTEEAKEKLEEDRREKEEHPYSEYVDPIQILLVSCGRSILIIAFVFGIVIFGGL